MKNRRDFLKTACKPVVLATLGIPLLEACSSEELSTTVSTVDSNNSATERAPLTINISSGDFTVLQEVGGWINYTGENLLLVRISEEVIRVFDNKCPHQGRRDLWVYDGSEFTCQNHNNSFTNTCSGGLQCYTASLSENILSITFD
ncbi:Rieske 2Fe-2S domain-containing protein [Flavobacteriaceae bacterium]|jgi:nitrite reductase/ring-hydroxylating ferredoxin subunit|nr:Rieske 2Fe-2S domain-containing protein [Flavobacteriaceae bacterium]MDA9588221.1 Rieske 2Fe-2S domain-containing protein [Flavobacteriaceae bacterium]